MPEYSQKAYTTFAGGLITEATKLGFPPNASVDELNCELNKDGSRQRRLGIEYEDNYSTIPIPTNSETVVSTHIWSNVGNQSGVEFIVVQVGRRLRFFKQSSDNLTVTDNEVLASPGGLAYQVDMDDFANPYGMGASSSSIQVASIKGALVVCSPDINTFYITYDPDTETFTETEITFRVRDFEYLGSTSAYDSSSSTTPSIERRYDTLNCGWNATPTTDPLAIYTAAKGGRYPALTHPWYSGKDNSGNFDVSEWEQPYTGNSLIVNGHFVYNMYDMDRDFRSGLSGVPRKREKGRFSTVEGFAGRVFYAGMKNSTNDNSSKIYFSRLIVSGFKDLGNLYQINDPTSEEISSLLDTDGGFISIPEIHEIKKLHAFGAALYVFADNGVWRISGVDDVFRATEFSVAKISDDGLANVGSFVSAQGRPYWWSYSGIFTFRANEVGDILPVNLSISTIQTYWNNTTSASKQSVRSIYDKLNRRVMWLFSNPAEVTTNKKNRVLILDEVLQAFYPWAFEDETSDTNYVVDLVYQEGLASDVVEFQVIDGAGNLVTDSLGNQVVLSRLDRTLTEGRVKYLAFDAATDRLVFAELKNKSFLDWGTESYSSYAEAAYNFMDDLETRKTAPYVTCYMNRTEEGWTDNGGGSYSIVRPSSLKVSSYWDFKDASSSNPQQAYKYMRTPVPDIANLSNFEYYKSVVTSRLKLRGRGRSLKIRFESEEGKDFHLLGYNLLYQPAGRF